MNIGLVLSGGGATGALHIGVIKALENSGNKALKQLFDARTN